MSIPSTPPPRRGLRRRDKVLIGCALGCGGLVLLVGAALFGGLYWLLSPGDQVPTEGIVGAGAAGWLRLPDPGEDEGLADLVATFVLEADRAERGAGGDELPGFFRKYQEMNLRSGAQGMRIWLPKDATLSFERITPSREGGGGLSSDPASSGDGDPPGDGEIKVVAAVNLRSFPRAIRSLVASASSGEAERYRGRKVHRMAESDAAVAFYGTTLLFSDSEILLRRAIDRLDESFGEGAGGTTGEGPAGDPESGSGGGSKAGGGSPAPSRREAEASGTSPFSPPTAVRDHWDAYGAITGAADVGVGLVLLEDFLPAGSGEGSSTGEDSSAGEESSPGEGSSMGEDTPAAPEPPWDPYPYSDAVETLRFGVDVVSADAFRADLTLDCASEEAAAYWSRRLTGQGSVELGTVDLGITMTAHQTGTRTAATLELTGFRAWLVQFLRDVASEAHDEEDLPSEAPASEAHEEEEIPSGTSATEPPPPEDPTP